MARITKPLTDTTIKNAKVVDKQKSLFDGGGLYLVIKPNKTKTWRCDFKLNGKRLTKTLGKYPHISLKKARLLNIEIQNKAIDGIDPREKIKDEMKLEDVVKEWLNMMKSTWAQTTLNKIEILFSKNIYAYSGQILFTKVTRKDILRDIDRILERGKAESANRLITNLNRVYKYAVGREYCEHNIIADLDKTAILPKIEEKHYVAITKEKELKKLLKDINNYRHDYSIDIRTAIALEIAPFLALRPFNLRSLEVIEINFAKKQIEIPKEKMKNKEDFILPVGDYVLDKLDEAIKMNYNDSKYIFASGRGGKDRQISDNTLNAALRRMGYHGKHTMHSFRSTFSTNTHDMMSKHGYNSMIIEACLSHADTNKVRTAYNRSDKTKYLEEKRGLINFWSDWLLILAS